MKKKFSFLVLFLLVLAACASQGAGQEISRERAIEIARQNIHFKPDRIEAVKETEEGRPVWRVTFYKGSQEVSSAHLGQVSFVVLDRKTGEVVSLGMS
jgi:uncharacterized membrane protein YkoI